MRFASFGCGFSHGCPDRSSKAQELQELAQIQRFAMRPVSQQSLLWKNRRHLRPAAAGVNTGKGKESIVATKGAGAECA